MYHAAFDIIIYEYKNSYMIILQSYPMPFSLSTFFLKVLCCTSVESWESLFQSLKSSPLIHSHHLLIDQLLDRIPSIDNQVFSSDEPCCITGQEERCCSDLFGNSKPADGYQFFIASPTSPAHAFLPSSVSTTVGLIAFTVILNWPHSMARFFVTETTAALLAQ